jgi:hypothetical protein
MKFIIEDTNVKHTNNPAISLLKQQLLTKAIKNAKLDGLGKGPYVWKTSWLFE